MAVSNLTRQQLMWLFVAQGTAMVPVYFILPWWLGIYWLAAVFWRIQIYRRALNFPGIGLKVAAIIAGLAGLALSFPALFSVESFVSFFIISFTLKLIELYDRKDGLLIVNVSFVGISACFLFFQTIFIALYGLIALIILLQAWIALYQSKGVSFSRRLRKASLIFIQALPVMLLLFVAMPRLGQLWHMPSQNQTGVTGFSDRMSPGGFSNLVESNSVAFRVTFESGPVPAPSQRYWRALVLDEFDGTSWYRAGSWRSWVTQRASATQPHPSWNMDYVDAGPVQQYSILLEPHRQRWLFNLMAPTRARSSGIRLQFTEFGTLSAMTKVGSRSQYTVYGYPEYKYSPAELDGFERRASLALPPRGNMRARQYATELQQKYSEHAEPVEQIMREVLKHFNEQFTYTLQPSAFTENIVDAFLFDTQRGFCEHFSSSFVFLMRAAGIPARVVVGYQGGDFNPVENYLIVRQRDAHAWAEIWMEGEGWLRVDPTAAVAPSRIERGLNQALPSAEAALVGGGEIGVLNWLQLRLDAWSYNWHRWVLSYDESAQNKFFEHVLGGNDVWRIALFFVMSSALLLCVYFIYAFWPSAKRRRYEQSRAYARHLKMLARFGFVKHAGETPLQFASRVAVTRPDWRKQLERIAQTYNQIAYQHPNESLRAHFIALCNWRPE